MPKSAAPGVADELLRLKSALERGLIEPDAYDRLKVELVMRVAAPATGPKGSTGGVAAIAATILTMPALLAGGLAVLLAGAGSQILDIFSRSGPG